MIARVKECCPLCGSPNWAQYVIADPVAEPTHYIECEDCGAHTGEFLYLEWAIEAWNRKEVFEEHD